MAQTNVLQLIITADAGQANKELGLIGVGLGNMERAAVSGGKKAAGGIDQLSYSATQARWAIIGMGEELGIRFPRFVSTFLSRIPAIGSAVVGAFSIVGIVGFIGILGQIPAAFDKIAEHLTGWDKQAQESFARMQKENKEYLAEIDKIAKAQEALKLIGIRPAAERAAGETGNVRTDKYRSTQELTDLQRQRVALEEQKAQSFGFMGTQFRNMGDLFFDAKNFDASRKDTADLNKEIDELDTRITAKAIEVTNLKMVEVPKATAEEKDAIEQTALARLEAQTSIADKIRSNTRELVKYQESAAQATQNLEMAGVERMTNFSLEQKQRLELAKYNVEVEYLGKARATALHLHDLDTEKAVNDLKAELAKQEREGLISPREGRTAVSSLSSQRSQLRENVSAEFDDKQLVATQQLNNQLNDLSHQQREHDLAQDSETLLKERDMRVRSAEDENAQTLGQKLALEQKKANIEIEYLTKLHDLKLANMQIENTLMTNGLILALASTGATIDEMKTAVASLNAEFEADKGKLNKDTGFDVTAAQDKAVQHQQTMIREQYQKTYDFLKREAGSVFDAMTKKGQNAWQELANGLKTAILNALKEIVTSKVAGSLMQMFTGVPVTHSSEGMSQGPLGGLGQALGIGAVPVFGGGPNLGGYAGSGNSGFAGGGGGGAFLGAPPITTGNTNYGGGWSGSSSTPMTNLGGYAGSGNSGFAGSGGGGTFQGFTGLVPRLKGLFNIGGVNGSSSIPTGPGSATTWSAASTAQRAGAILRSPGVSALELGVGSGLFFGGVQGPNPAGPKGTGQTLAGGALMGAALGSTLGQPAAWGPLLGVGAGLAVNGLQRGGVGGMLETTAGGALVGFQLGGPIGAAIGAAVGFTAGMIRMFIDGATQQARKQIKDAYGIDIKDNKVIQQILQMAKEKFGGSISMAIRSKDGTDLIKLYAMSTGQKNNFGPGMTSATFAASGGTLTQLPTYQNGTVVPSIGGGFVVDRIGGGVASNATPITSQIIVPLSLDGQVVAKKVVSVVQSSGRTIAKSAQQGMADSAGRRDITASLLQPSTLTG